MNRKMKHTYLSQLRVSLITSRYATTPLTWRASPSELEFNKLYYIRDGEGCVTINDKTYYPRRGDLLFIPEGCIHGYSLENQKPYTKYWCHFTANIGSQPLAAVCSFPSLLQVEEGTSAQQLEHLFDRLIEAERSPDPCAPILTQSVLLELVYFYLQTVGPEQLTARPLETYTDMSSLLPYIDQHLGSKLTLQQLADIVNVHPNYMVRLFKAQFGFTPIQYLNLQRIRAAKELLMLGKLSIKTVAEQTGFESPYYFTQVFKKHTGLTPTEFRKLDGHE
ncbi:AraC family transcriptional regulator [Paenibacillus sp. YYML68]|uniref:helix-turn-helix domain-containing protein n=1 Tax=Paenibacillus sp. YYML68 TaxID=2909250 RepID=UPI002492267C|nr:AraC family transcriptional regulator [Paenibacillus sp. YYML68]